jgi:hypothetical protein
MVNGEQSRNQRMFGLPFTIYCLPHALRSALSALRHEGSAKPGLPRRSLGEGGFLGP